MTHSVCHHVTIVTGTLHRGVGTAEQVGGLEKIFLLATLAKQSLSNCFSPMQLFHFKLLLIGFCSLGTCTYLFAYAVVTYTVSAAILTGTPLLCVCDTVRFSLCMFA